MVHFYVDQTLEKQIESLLKQAKRVLTKGGPPLAFTPFGKPRKIHNWFIVNTNSGCNLSPAWAITLYNRSRVIVRPAKMENDTRYRAGDIIALWHKIIVKLLRK